MTSDDLRALVERLRATEGWCFGADLYNEAADALERLQRRLVVAADYVEEHWTDGINLNDLLHILRDDSSGDESYDEWAERERRKQ